MNKNLLFISLLAITLVFSNKAFCQLEIVSVQSLESTCANNGSIIIDAGTDVPPLLYSIISGPLTAPVQTNNVFNSVPAGTYTIQVADASGAVQTYPAMVPGTYLQPDFDPVKVSPYCAGGSDGQITGNIIPGTGLGPFTWQLMAPSPVVTPPQSSDVFTGLPAGNYTIRVTDNCGGFRTVVTTLADAPSSMLTFIPGIGRLTKFGCDSANITQYLHADVLRFPITFTFQTSSGTFSTTMLTAPPLNTTTDFTLEQVLPGFNYGDYLLITATDDCGVTASTIQYSARPFNFCMTLNNYFDNCTYTSTAVFDMNNPGCQSPGQLMTGAAGPLVFEVTDPGGVIVDQGTAAGFLDNNGYMFISEVHVIPLPTNINYHIRITDRCGEVFETYFLMPSPVTLPPIIYTNVYPDGCTDSVAFAFVFCENFKSEPKLVFQSGPPGAGSTKPGYEYNVAYNYPDTIPVGGSGGNIYRFDISSLASGTYQFKIYDTCGTDLPGTMVISPTDVTNFGHQFSYKKGCLGLNEIHYTVQAANGFMNIRNLTTSFSTIKYYSSQDFPTAINDSLLNVPSGSYELTYTYQGYFATGATLGDGSLNCQAIRDTVIIEGYQTPAILANNYIQCQSGIHVEILPDSSKGVPPYQYEIISGPQTFPVQSSNLFNLLAPGVYTVRIYDICGNGSTSQITVDPIIFPPATVLPFSCNSTNVTYGSSAYFTYNWIAPNGTIFTGDTLSIDPVTPADTGIYTIIKIVNINGCIDTFYTAYHISLHNVNEQTLNICSGNSVTIGTHTYSTTGTYIDTLLNSSLCDSIIILHLNVVQFLRDSVTQTLCAGESILFNGELYNQSGYFSDTLTTAGCDSIITLHLIVLPEIRNNLIVSVCNGGSYTVNGHVYTQAGIYSDTLTTAGCDSIVVLNLTILPIIRDSITASVCAGQSYTMGGNMYTQTGIFSDTLITGGCYSIVVLHLTVSPVIRDSIIAVVCAGQSYSVGGNVYTQTGIFSDTLTTGSCDSIIVLNLTVSPVIRDSITISICAGQSYSMGGNVYTQTGVYSDTLSTAGCDSIVVLNLTVSPVIRDSITASVCAGQSYTMGGNMYTQAGIFSDTLTTGGCDSIVVLNLTVLPVIRDSIIVVVCAGQSYSMGGNVYTQTGIYLDTLSTAGCDSIVVVNLTVASVLRDTTFKTICAGQHVDFNGNVYTQPGTYSDTLHTGNCDSISSLQLNIIPAQQVNITSSAQAVAPGGMIQLSVTAAQSYLWTSTNASINNPLVQNPTAVITNATWIYVNATTNPGACVYQDSVYISILTDSTPCAGSHIYVPGAFTPNNDGLNDQVNIFSDKIRLVHFMIYNRWGEKVFETNDINYGWNGLYKTALIPGNYVYMISYYVPCDNKMRMMKGSVLLIR